MQNHYFSLILSITGHSLYHTKFKSSLLELMTYRQISCMTKFLQRISIALNAFVNDITSQITRMSKRRRKDI